MLKHISSSEIEENIKKDFTIVNAHAEWCGPCKMMGPILEEMGKKDDAKMDILRVNVDKNKEWAKENKIASIPTTFIYKGKEKIATIAGFASEEMIKEKMK